MAEAAGDGAEVEAGRQELSGVVVALWAMRVCHSWRGQADTAPCHQDAWVPSLELRRLTHSH